LSDVPFVQLHDPFAVWIEKQEQDDRERHHVHVEHDDDRTMVKVPAMAEAAEGIAKADEGDERGQGKLEGWSSCRPVIARVVIRLPSTSVVLRNRDRWRGSAKA
jgi:hypothetical protein